jgi:ubiquinone/menaquinone biosynthesis C-methylase UbiE
MKEETIMDDLARYNRERWNELVQANVEYSRPFLDLNKDSARAVVDPMGIMGDVAGKDVLCLAGGGGQQSVAFGLLGARVTVFDLSDGQLEQDRAAAAHYQLQITTIQGDMRDLSAFAGAAFDLVWQAFSINFIPDPHRVFKEVARVLRTDGLYRLEYFNPFTQMVDEAAWNGESYPLKHPYFGLTEVTGLFPHWDVSDEQGVSRQVKSPREFRHPLSTILNNLAKQGFVLLAMREAVNDQPDPEPGTWEHFKSIVAPYLTFWTTYRPYVFTGVQLP